MSWVCEEEEDGERKDENEKGRARAREGEFSAEHEVV